MRTNDHNHVTLIERLRKLTIDQPIYSHILQTLVNNQLTRTDVDRDPDWSSAPIVVTLNEIRERINYTMACQFANQNNLPVIKWKLPISGIRATTLNKEETEELYNHEIS